MDHDSTRARMDGKANPCRASNQPVTTAKKDVRAPRPSPSTPRPSPSTSPPQRSTPPVEHARRSPATPPAASGPAPAVRLRASAPVRGAVGEPCRGGRRSRGGLATAARDARALYLIQSGRSIIEHSLRAYQTQFVREEAKMRHLKISAIPILLVVFSIAAFADEQRQFDVSHAWFKPELLVNDQPALCEPIFKGYVSYFVSPGAVNPLKPISTRDWEKYTPGVLTETIRALEWGTVGEEEKVLRLAQWRQDGQYFGVVERSQAIGWRPPTYHYYLIDTPLSDTDMAHGTNEHYGQGVLAYLHETQTQGVFDVIYEADTRFENYNESIFVQVANLYVFNQRVY